MSEKKIDDFDRQKKSETTEEIQLGDERRFSQKLDELVLEAEEMRIRRMRQHRTRGFIALNFSLLAATLGAAAFGWYFLIQLDIQKAAVSVIASMLASFLVYVWAGSPIKTYKREHKTVFMPKLAKALGGFTYDQNRGMNQKILQRSLVLPHHDRLHAEDCFTGTYKGVKVIFSEARLYTNAQKNDPVFQGIFVLMEAAGESIEGHTIVTANPKLVQSQMRKTWKDLSKVYITPSNPDWDVFQVYSSKPDAAELIVGDRLLKELAEAAAIFNNAHLTAVLFGKKFIFVMIPNDTDMFEASDLYVPIATQQYAMRCRKEIGQIIEIIDVFELYQPLKA